MESANPQTRPGEEPGFATAAFYRHVLETLHASAIPFLVGGAYALHRYTGVNRHTRDLDIFIRRHDLQQVSDALRQVGYTTELPFPHWLAKVHANGVYIDLIFSSGNAVAEVDDAWFDYAMDEQVLDIPTRICPAEEMIWSKAFIMERERFDGADILHLLRARAAQLDWPRLFRRFEPHWRVLLAHLTLFGFVYPAQRALVPAAIMDELIERLRHETHSPAPQHDICLGTLLSREQYLNDIGPDGLQDGRATPLGNMTERDIAIWTQAIPDSHKPH
ncbi:MAG TPA: nucleotidyltransferase [Noviherbaspirillum sp.]|nr:nucleotidyltransferase [Noviherbaspirillum sp.]